MKNTKSFEEKHESEVWSKLQERHVVDILCTNYKLQVTSYKL